MPKSTQGQRWLGSCQRWTSNEISGVVSRISTRDDQQWTHPRTGDNNIVIVSIHITDYIGVFISLQSIVHEILDKELLKYTNSEGIVIDGYPRNIGQLNYFEKKVFITIITI